MGKLLDNIRKVSEVSLILLTIFLFLFFSIVHITSYQYIIDTITDAVLLINSNEGILSLLLSSLLIALYYLQYRIQISHTDIAEKQANIQSRQAKIMERQTDWVENEQSPDISVHNWDITGENLESEIHVSNFGNGAGYEPILIFDINPLKSKYIEMRSENYIHHTPPEDLPEYLYKTDQTLGLYRDDDKYKEKSPTVIEPSEYNIVVYNTTGISSVFLGASSFDNVVRGATWGKYFQKLSQNGVKDVYYDVYLRYTYAFEKEKRKKLYSGYVYPDDVQSPIDLISKTHTEVHFPKRTTPTSRVNGIDFQSHADNL